MPGLIRAGAVAPAVKQAKSGGAGLRARRHWWHRISSRCARTGKMPVPPRTFVRTFSCSWAFGPPINYEKFLMGIPLTLNLEL